MSLREYVRKRDFARTAEPAGGIRESQQRRFVVQKHAATRLHYDFRLEMNGVLKSWAVPKGFPMTKGEKRLAVHVEDHPVSYRDFEGTIPKGQYGGGTVMVWDRGTYGVVGKSPASELATGKLHFVLHGKKLKGEWYLVRMRDEKQWLLIRKGDDLRPVSKKQEDTSALSGKSMKQLSAGNGAVWNSKPKARAAPSRRGFLRLKAAKTRPRAVPAFVEPMLARLVSQPPAGDWIYEIKFDGFRALALKEGDEVHLLSRNKKDFRERFPEIAESVAALKVDSAALDGEIVALDAKGRSSFQLLQARELGTERPPLAYYVFDLLQANGEDLKDLPVDERKSRLEALLKKPPGLIRYSASLRGAVKPLLKKAQALGLEGLIGKAVDSKYEPSARSGAWIKLKLHNEQEFVIGGYTDPEGSRHYFGALLIGFYRDRELRFAGKVGTGFDTKLLRELHRRFAPLTRKQCPFVNLPETKASRYSVAMTAREMRRCHWLKPRLVCQIRFSEWTRDEKLRQPVFLGLREDKNVAEVVREKVS